MNELLLIEIGGTHTRCATPSSAGRLRDIATFQNSGYAGVEAIIAAYLDAAPKPAPTRAALAVAADVDARPLRVTNRGWTLDVAALQARFGWTRATIVNDFEALACAVPELTGEELATVRPGEPAHGAALAVIGPGTGLGVSGLLPGAVPIRGEGGHVTLAAADEQEAAVLRALRRDYGHVSGERVLSGPGLLAVYRVLGGTRAESPQGVTRLAARGDRQAGETLDLFFRFLGTVCADLALTLGARGGVYLGGGILPGIREQLLASGFSARFVDKGRYAAYLESIPVTLITAPTPALHGLLQHPEVNDR